MQTFKSAVIVHNGTTEEIPWTHKDTHQDAEAETENDRAPINEALTACCLTAALNIIAFHTNEDTRAQMCASTALKFFSSLHPSIRDSDWCETSFFLVAITTCLHWSCIFSLFTKQPRWTTRFLPRIIMATLVTLLPLATVTRDPTTVFVRLLPVVTDLYVVAALLVDYILQRRLTGESAC
ncbi:hypothetical protein J3F83DRAFT_741580 [Trichoderma novae-zelandiae]